MASPAEPLALSYRRGDKGMKTTNANKITAALEDGGKPLPFQSIPQNRSGPQTI
jgi:hypothetical protein